MIQDGFIEVAIEEIKNPSVGLSDPSLRDETILRNFDLLLPKFHFPIPWGKFVSSLTLPDFLPRRDL